MAQVDPSHISVLLVIEPVSPPKLNALKVVPHPARADLLEFKPEVVVQEEPLHFSVVLTLLEVYPPKLKASEVIPHPES